ncbi:MAG: chitobiase/beta-hexosaminidase C-terminal domain-containing protein [Kineothrix sp.]
MLISNDKSGRKKQKYYEKKMNQTGCRARRVIRPVPAAAGIILSLAAVILAIMAVSFFPSRAVAELKLVSNNGTVMGRGEALTVMDGAEIYIEGYSDSDSGAVYYELTDVRRQDIQGADLSSSGTRYSSGSPIRLSSAGEGGAGYLYIQQLEGETSRCTEYRVSFLESLETLGGITSLPGADSSDGAAVKAGDIIEFMGTGTMYYTEDGSIPTLVRDRDGDIRINGESFRAEKPGSVKKLEGNTLTVTEEWKAGETRVFQLLAYMEGFDLGQVHTFRFRRVEEQSRKQAEPPAAVPESGSPVTMDSRIYLTTSIPGGIILYTLDGSEPGYQLLESESGYALKLEGTTRRYGQENPHIEVKEAGAARGESILLLAKAIQVDLTAGQRLLEDSATAKFSYRISEAKTVAAPEALPETKAEEPAVVRPGERILLSCATPGADIYYTLDGTAPVLGSDGAPGENTRRYSAGESITVPQGEGKLTISAMAVKAGMNPSAVVQFVYQYPAMTAPPYAVPGEGTISANTEVTLGSIDEGARIYYTLDGSEPSVSNGSLYTAPILLAQDTIIKAVSVVEGSSSAVKAFTYYVAKELTAPVPSVQSGAILSSGTVIRLTAQQGAVIYYTTDGSDPREGSPMTGDRVNITGEPGESITLTVCAKGSDYSDSPAAAYVYTISSYENGVKADPEAGTIVKEGEEILLQTDVTDGVIYYATGGSNPTLGGAQGTRVTVEEAEGEEVFTLKAMAVPAGAEYGGAFTAFTYEYIKKLPAPAASIPHGAVLLKTQEVELTAETGDIYYTLDESEPDEDSNLYTEPIPVTSPATIKAVAISEEGAESEVSSFSYTFAEQTEPPVFSLESGEVKAGMKLTITSPTPGAVIYYTMDGREPDPDEPGNLFVYSGAITLNKAVNIKAIAVKERMAESRVTGAIYTMKEPELLVQEERQEPEEKTEGNRLRSRSTYLNEGSGSGYGDFVLRSAATGVVISAREGAIPVESGLEVTEMPVSDSLNRSVAESAGREYGAVASYEVTLTWGGEIIQPEKRTELGLPIPQGYDNSAISIAYVDDEGGVELCETRRENGMVYAFVDRFDRYCIVAPVNWEREAKDSDWERIILAAGAVLLAAGYLLLRIGKRKKTSILDD